MTTGAASGWSSSGAKSRPSSGACRSSWKVLAVTSAPPNPLRRAASVADVHLVLVERRQAFEGVRLGAPVLQVRDRDALLVVGDDVARIQVEDLLGVIERQAADEDRVDEGEDRRVQADAEAERERRHDREPGIVHAAAGMRSGGPGAASSAAIRVRPAGFQIRRMQPAC